MRKSVEKTKEKGYLRQWLIQYRNLNNLTQQELATRAGISQYAIRNYENGRQPSGYIIIKKIADAMGVTVDTLYEALDSDKVKSYRVSDLKLLASRAHRTSVAKGWWKDYNHAIGQYKPFIIAAKVGLIITELSEALEELRRNRIQLYIKDGKPEGFVVELADALIRLLDLCQHLGLDILGAAITKMDYNDTREVMHGGKLF